MRRTLLGITTLLVGCTAPTISHKTLDDAGYTDIHAGGWAWLECSGDDMFSTEFRARNVNGKQVDGVVCCGLFLKGCTIRH